MSFSCYKRSMTPKLEVTGLSLLINKIGWPYKKEIDKILLTHKIF